MRRKKVKKKMNYIVKKIMMNIQMKKKKIKMKMKKKMGK